ncbi:MAG TPA: DNA/RNA non-specific endonuclease [Melioribacteraceae bacterium]|nr:DNA/RNA non-specific endonuclease [Melioribacteraceae bacterium]
MKRNLFFLSSLLFIILILSCSGSSTVSVDDKTGNRGLVIDNINVAAGVPADQDSTDDFIIIRQQYVLSYNPVRNVPNWVSWNLDSSWFGDASRYKGSFIADTTLPDSFYRVRHSDYTGSGYDRGHMVRSEERTRNDEDNKSTFILSSVLPQRPDLNRGVWLDLEYFCEDLCKNEKKKLFIIAGGIFRSENRIKEKIAVPDSCFKIIVVLNEGESVESVTDTTSVIAVVMPNVNGIRSVPWSNYVTTIRRIESSTGYDFLSNVSRSVQEIIEKRIYISRNTN